VAFSREERIALFVALFKERDDVFARRWQKFDGSVSGYAPVYTDWKKKDAYQPLTKEIYEKHLLGTIVLGLYPLLSDNTSHFLAVDFDGDTWLEDAKRLLKTCEGHQLPVYLERSRSGRGGYVWCFFESPYPAYKSRKIFLSLLRESRTIDEFDKDDSFDRLFPNQDTLSGKGIGNLVALPFQGESVKSGNTVFLDPGNGFQPYADRWEFVNSVRRASQDSLDVLFTKLTPEDTAPQVTRVKNKNALHIVIKEMLKLQKQLLPPGLINLLREELNFFNAERLIKQKMGFATYDTEKYFKAVKTDDAHVYVPRGFLPQIEAYTREHGIAVEKTDERTRLDPIGITPTFSLLKHQVSALEAMLTEDMGVLVAPPGAGKTVIGLALIAARKQPALILTHRKQIYDQWLGSIERFFGIPKKEIGQFASLKKLIKQPVTIAMMQTLARATEGKEISEGFGTVIVDECHHVPARMFREAVARCNPKYLYGLTATPKRKNNDEKLIYAYLGPCLYTLSKSDIAQSDAEKAVGSNAPTVIIRETKMSLPFTPKARDFQTVTKILSFDTERNRLICEDIAKEVRADNKCLVLTERKEHAEILDYYLHRDFEIILFTGDLTPKQRSDKEKQIKHGDFQVLIATGQILGEGSDIADLDCLFLVFPFSFEGKLTQYIGRIERGEQKAKKVYDYRDKEIPLLERLYKRRQRYYNKLRDVGEE